MTCDPGRARFRSSRRTVLGAALGGVAGVALGSSAALATPREPDPGAIAGPKAVPRHPTAAARPAGAPTITSDDLVFTPRTRLRAGRARQVGLDPEHVDQLATDIARFLRPTPETPAHPEYAGATVIAAKDGVIVAFEAAGKAVRYGLDGDTVVELPADQQIDAAKDTIWDLASMSKLFTATSIMQLIERGKVGFEEPVISYLPDFASHGKSDILVRHLLTHTSGLIPDPIPSLWQGYDSYDERVAAILDTEPDAAPGIEYVYSDINFLALGLIVEKVSGQTLDRYVHEHITAPLRMRDTQYNPPERLKPRIAAEEYEPWADRGMVWGTVHDENAWALNGVAGHAGVFSTAYDMAIFAQMYLNGGIYNGVRILQEKTVRLMLHDYNGAQFPYDTHGLAWELGQTWYHGAIWSPVSFGHTGFTGTTIVVDPIAHQFVILMANRVHPDRNWGSNNPSRRAVADDLGLATPVRPESANTWFSGRVDRRTATLDIPLPATGSGQLEFDYWYDTEPLYDYGRFQSSADGSSFQPLPVTFSGGRWKWTADDGSVTGYGGRRWLHGTADLPAGTTAVRWTYQTDSSSEGRGIYLADITVRDGSKIIFDSRRTTDAASVITNGWTALGPA